MRAGLLTLANTSVTLTLSLVITSRKRRTYFTDTKMDQPCASTLRQPWREWYAPVDGPLGARMIIPYMAAGNGNGMTTGCFRPTPLSSHNKLTV
jgi:hypothetical protein